MTQEVNQIQSITGDNNDINNSHHATDTMDKPSHQVNDLPKDKYNIVYVLFLFLGMCTLLPYNMFLTATSYFSAKLNGTHWQYSYQNYFLVAYSVPAIIASAVIVPLLRFINLKVRMIVSPLILLVLFIFTTVMVRVDTSTWVDTFFIITIVGIVIANSFGSAVYQSSLFGLASLFPKQYSQSVVSGQALAGIFTSAASIISLLGSSDAYQSAIMYFICAIGALLVCVVSYILLRKIEYARYHMQKLDRFSPVDTDDVGEAETRFTRSGQVTNSNATDEHDVAVAGTERTGSKRNVFLILKKNWPIALAGMLSFTITLGVFPGVTSRIQSTHDSSNNTFFSKFFTPVTCFLTFNVADFIGRFLGLWLLLPNYKHGITLLLLSLIRSGFIPIFLFCNAQPRTWLPVLIESDVAYVVSLAIFGISNGYIVSLATMYAPMRVGVEHAETTGAIMAACLILGIGLGSALSFATVALL